jgi:hypothetical protein
MPSSRPDPAVIALQRLMADTVRATRSHDRIGLIHAAQCAIARNPGSDQLLRDYTDAIFRNTEMILDDLEATAR